MAINLLKVAEIKDSTDSNVSLTHIELSRESLQKIAGVKEGTVSVPALSYICFDANIKHPFYCKDFTMNVSSATPSGYMYFQSQSFLEWRQPSVTASSGVLIVDFNNELPDQAQLLYRFRFTYANFDSLSSTIHSCQLLTVDYPIDFDFIDFSVVATSYNNAPIRIYNNSVQQTYKDVRVLPPFSSDYELDSVYMLTASGKDDIEKYNIQRGFRFPEDAGWDTGRFSSEATVSGYKVTLSGVTVSGTWTSPVIYTPDEDYITMYVYGEDLGENSFIEKDFKRVDNLVEVRASDQSPLPNFLISSWTQRLYRPSDMTDVSLPLPAKRYSTLGYQDVPDNTSSFWVPQAALGPPCGTYDNPGRLIPYILGRSKRMYVKGDGTILAQSPVENDENTFWEYGHRYYDAGIPYKEFGDINSFWAIGQFLHLIGSFGGACGAVSGAGTVSTSKWHQMAYATESNASYWSAGKNIGDRLISLLPYAYHYKTYNFGTSAEACVMEPVGSYTLAVDNQPNEWVVVTAILYPLSSGDKFICLYYLDIRNFWVVDIKYLGAYGVGDYLCDEGWAVCKSNEGGFWLHVGYLSRIIDKYDVSGNLLISNRVNYDFNNIRITKDPAGLWAIRNDAVYWYSEDTDGTLTEEFSITSDSFQYLQAGDVDDYNNLWLTDRDGATVYRINFANRSIDYEKELEYVAAVWPHPRDGSAYLYTSFNANSFSTSVDRIWVNDPYGYRETLFSLPEFPISDYSGVQFKGKALTSYLDPPINDPVWGTNDSVTLEWQPYPNASLALPSGKYKQFRVTLQRNSSSITPPKLSKIRIPKSLVLNQVEYKGYKEAYLNTHLRYNKKYGHFTTDLVVWWPH
jgi:hypothetical protein